MLALTRTRANQLHFLSVKIVSDWWSLVGRSNAHTLNVHRAHNDVKPKHATIANHAKRFCFVFYFFIFIKNSCCCLYEAVGRSKKKKNNAYKYIR